MLRISTACCLLLLLASATALPFTHRALSSGRATSLHQGHVLVEALEFEELRAQHGEEQALRKLAGSSADAFALPPPHFFNQTLDHFDALNSRTYLQRYYVNDTFWTQDDGPIFLYIEGEGAASPFDALYGHHMEMAAEMGALVFAVEHRYYGASVPVDDMTTPNMRWLSSQQALADLSTFLTWARKEYKVSSDSKTICFGGSYPGALSAWFRTKYPHQVVGAVSSSSPVRALVDFQDYNNVDASSLATTIVGGSKTCLEAVSKEFESIQQMLTTTQGRQQLDNLYNPCKSLVNANANDTATFHDQLAGIFEGTIQYNNEQPGALNIDAICKYFTDGGDGLPALAKMYFSGECIDISYLDSIAGIMNTTVDKSTGGVGMRQWTYQTCTQFGYYQTCETGTQCPFGPPSMTLKANLALCADAFGISPEAVNERVDFSNDYYGADHPDGSNVLFVNGKVDPWHALSVLSDLPNNQTAILIDGTAHCANMQSTRPSDPPQLTAARKEIEKVVAGWLA